MACAQGPIDVVGDEKRLRKLDASLLSLFMEFFDKEVGVISVRSMCEALAPRHHEGDEERQWLYEQALDAGWARLHGAIADEDDPAAVTASGDHECLTVGISSDFKRSRCGPLGRAH